MRPNNKPRHKHRKHRATFTRKSNLDVLGRNARWIARHGAQDGGPSSTMTPTNFTASLFQVPTTFRPRYM